MPDHHVLSAAELDAYCRRIGWAGPLQADLATVRALHAAHSAAIPFENIDVQLGRQPSREPSAVFAKLVEAGRGGWCHEQNTLFGAVLATIGFEVTRLAGGVLRPGSDVPPIGSHLTLKVIIDEAPWLVDVGFGSWVGAPIPLAPGEWPLSPWPLALTQAGREWRLTADLGSYTMTYAFADEPGDEALMAEICHWQSHDPASPFVQNLVVQRRIRARDWTLRGRVLTETSTDGTEQRLLHDADDLMAVLRDVFALNVPEVAELWPAIVARHEALFQEPATPTT